jgi:hypothetical protein
LLAADITDPAELNSKRERSCPRVVKRARHSHFPVKKPGQHSVRHDGPPTIVLANPTLTRAKTATAALPKQAKWHCEYPQL